MPTSKGLGAVLGIDAAWSTGNPSGVALAAQVDGAWTCLAVAPSYELFVQGATGPDLWRKTPRGGPAPVAGLLDRAGALLRQQADGPDIAAVAVDMPLSHAPIIGRRVSDNKASQALGRFKCGTHSPSLTRPGPVSEALHAGFREQGFSLATTDWRGSGPALLEVYPHAALVGLFIEKGNMAQAGAQRLKYKVSRSRQHWPELDRQARAEVLCRTFANILALLRQDMAGIPEFPMPRADACTLAGLKRFEDALDALVCCWMGIRFLEGKARCLGDAESGIWVPDNL